MTFKKGHKWFGNENTRNKISMYRKKVGVPWLIGKKLSIEHKKKIGKNNIGKHSNPRPTITADKHYLWKGDKASYCAKHVWIKKHFGIPDICENIECSSSSKKYSWANISGKYTRERKDWIKLCYSCHKKLDLGILTIDIVKEYV